MMRNLRLQEQLDAYRDASDLARPEMEVLAGSLLRDRAVADELARRQHFDRVVGAGLNDLPQPAGLEERLMAALTAAEQSSAPVTLPLETIVGEAVLAKAGRELASLPRKSALHAGIASRGIWYAGITAVVLLLLASGSGYYWHRSRQMIEQEQIASALNGWQKAAHQGHSERTLPSKFVLPLDVKPVRYVPFKTDEGWSAVAVDCRTKTGNPATLYIVSSSANFRVGDSHITRLAARGKKVGAWKRGRLLYVLVEEDFKPRAGAVIRYANAPTA
jgi:hypothetical protein